MQDTLSNKTELKNLVRAVNLTENDAEHTFKLLPVALRMNLQKTYGCFEQSM